MVRNCEGCGKELLKDEKRISVGKTEWLKKIAIVSAAKELKVCEECLAKYCFCCGSKFEELTQGKIDINMARYGFHPSEGLPFSANYTRYFVCPNCYKPLKEMSLRLLTESQIKNLKKEPTVICQRCKGVNDSIEESSCFGKRFVARFCKKCRIEYGSYLNTGLHNGEKFTIDHVNEQDGFTRWAKERKPF